MPTPFRTIDELVRTLANEKKLLSDMFQKRKSITFRVDDARALLDHKESRLRYLIDHGVIRDTGDFLEMEDVYLKFFEDVLEINETINVAAVQEFIDQLNANIDYYLEEKNERRRYNHLRQVRHILRTIALTTLRNVVDLKRNVDNTYKNEPNLKIKKAKLQRLDQKYADIASLITEAEKVIDERQPVFFAVATDVGMLNTINDVKLQLNDAYHNLLEISRQIINYLNMIELQSKMLEKLHQLKYLRDQLILEEYTNVTALMEERNPLWLEVAPRYSTKPSLRWLKETDSDEPNKILRHVLRNRALPSGLRRTQAPPIDAQYLQAQEATDESIDQEALYDAFAAQGKDLFNFVMGYNYKKAVDLETRLVLFCQLATRFSKNLNITNQMGVTEDLEYAIIYRK